MCVTYTTGYSEHNSLLSDGVLLNNSPHTLSYRKQCRWNQAVTRLLRIQNWKRSHFLSCWDLSMSAQTNRLYSPQNLWCWQCCDGICCTVHVLKGPFAFMIYLFFYYNYYYYEHLKSIAVTLECWGTGGSGHHASVFGKLLWICTSCPKAQTTDWVMEKGGKKAHLQAVEA